MFKNTIAGLALTFFATAACADESDKCFTTHKNAQDAVRELYVEVAIELHYIDIVTTELKERRANLYESCSPATQKKLLPFNNLSHCYKLSSENSQYLLDRYPNSDQTYFDNKINKAKKGLETLEACLPR